MTNRFDNAVVPWVPDDDAPPTIVLPPNREEYTPPPPVMEKTFSLIVWLTGSLVVALLATVPMYLAGAPAFFNVSLGIVIVGALVFIYLAFDSRWFHTVSHEKTRRIEVQAQVEIAHLWYGYQTQRLQLESHKAAQLPEPTDTMLPIAYEQARAWVRGLFDGEELNPDAVLDSGKVQIKRPNRAALDMLKRCQWLVYSEEGRSYYWHGPTTLTGAMQKFDRHV